MGRLRPNHRNLETNLPLVPAMETLFQPHQVPLGRSRESPHRRKYLRWHFAHLNRAAFQDKYKEKFKSYFVKDVEFLSANSTGKQLKKTESIISVNGLIFSKNDTSENLLTAYLNDGTRKSTPRPVPLDCCSFECLQNFRRYGSFVARS
jgi:hypothetical protein